MIVTAMQEVLRGKTFTFHDGCGVFSKKVSIMAVKHLIETMELREDAKVLDVGCGYGPIGLSAAVLASARACDNGRYQ